MNDTAAKGASIIKDESANAVMSFALNMIELHQVET